MSMIVTTAIRGITDLELLLEALREMRITVEAVDFSGRSILGRRILAQLRVEDGIICIVRNRHNRNLELIGDQDWKIMKDKGFADRVRQQYGVAAVKQKAAALNYRIASVQTEEDGSIRIIARAWG